MHPGVYCRQGDQTTIMVFNMGKNEYELSAFVLIGRINESNRQEDLNINTLDHKEPVILSKTELQKRLDFIEKSRKLKENKILLKR